MSAKELQIITVEDNSVISLLVTEYLSALVGQPCNIISFNNGRAFLEGFDNENLPDVVILDVYLPEMTGIEVRQEIIEKGMPPSRVFLISTDHGNVENGLVKGDFTLEQAKNIMLKKPIDVDQITGKLNELGIKIRKF